MTTCRWHSWGLSRETPAVEPGLGLEGEDQVQHHSGLGQTPLVRPAHHPAQCHRLHGVSRPPWVLRCLSFADNSRGVKATYILLLSSLLNSP